MTKWIKWKGNDMNRILREITIYYECAKSKESRQWTFEDDWSTDWWIRLSASRCRWMQKMKILCKFLSVFFFYIELCIYIFCFHVYFFRLLLELWSDHPSSSNSHIGKIQVSWFQHCCSSYMHCDQYVNFIVDFFSKVVPYVINWTNIFISSKKFFTALRI